MRILVASDHAGFELKKSVLRHLKAEGHSVRDLGTKSLKPVDYPDYAEKLGLELKKRSGARGILICGSGVGASIAVNKIRGMRASVCHDYYSAHQGVEHDDMNVLVLGSRVVGEQLALDLVEAFLKARFKRNVTRYKRRVQKIIRLEEKNY